MSEKTCLTCRWCDAGLLARLFRTGDGAKCRNPTVLENLHLAHAQGMRIPSYLYGGSGVTPADPVTGAPERREIYCSDARRQQMRFGVDVSPLGAPVSEEVRAQSNCGPDGRYWDGR